MGETLPGRYLWDLWPVQEIDGSVDGGELWVALVADAIDDPEKRQDAALAVGSTGCGT